MADSLQETIDFTMMYATHDAFRRDLDRLLAAAVTGTAYAPQVRAGWRNFMHQLLIHHSVEDSNLWPRVQEEVADRPRELTLLAEMETEHNLLDPLLASVDEGLTDGAADLTDRVTALKAVLIGHLDHEEKSALPLIQEVLTPDDWRAFAGKMRERQGVKGAAVYVPWIVDGLPEEDRRRFLNVLPPPVRLLNQVLWEPRYRRRAMWVV